MGEVFLIILVVVGICVLGLCFNIIFRKKEFPQYDVGANEDMRRIGIRCFREEDAELHSGPARCAGDYSDACKDCNLYRK